MQTEDGLSKGHQRRITPTPAWKRAWVWLLWLPIRRSIKPPVL